MSRKVSVEIVGDDESLRRAFQRSGHAAQLFEKDLGRTARGAAAASLSFHGLGRAALYASGYLAGGAGLTFAFKSAIESAEGLEKAQRSLAVVVNRNGGSFKEQLPTIQAWANAQSKFGVSVEEAEQGLARAAAITGKAATGMRAYTEALEISKATGRSFNTVLLAASKANEGQTTALSRYIGKIKTGTGPLQLWNDIQAKYAGQAAANTNATDQLTASLKNTEVTVGEALLPTVNKYASKLNDWLSKSQNQERIQRDVNKAVHDASVVVGDLAEGARTAANAVGGFKNAIKLLLALKVASVLSGWTSSIGMVGDTAYTSAGKVDGLKLSLKNLAALGAVAVTVDVLENLIPKGKLDAQGQKILNKEGVGGLGNTPIIGRPARWGAALGRDLGKGLGINYGPGNPIPKQYRNQSDLSEAFSSGRENEAFPFSFTSKNFGAEWRAYAAGRKAGGDAIGATASTSVGGGGTKASPKSKPYELTSAQRNALTLAGNPNDVAALRTKLAQDQKAAAFAKAHFAAGKGSKALFQSWQNVLQDEASLRAQIAALEKKGDDAKTAAHKKELEALKKSREEAARHAAALKQAFGQAVSQAFSAIGDLGQGPVATGDAASFLQQYGGHLTGKAYLQDITQQNNAFSKELKNIGALRKRGAPKGLLDTLLGQGASGASMVQALAADTPKQLQAFLHQYQRRQKLVTQAAHVELNSQTVSVTAKNVTVQPQTQTPADKFGRVGSSGRRR